MKKSIVNKTSSIIIVLIAVLMLFAPVLALTAGAARGNFDWTTDRSGKIHQVVDGSELTDEQTHFSLSYDVKGGRDFQFHYSMDWAKWEGKVNASPGEVITVSYTATYPSLKDQFYYDEVAKDYSAEYKVWEYTDYFREESVDGEWFTYLHDNRQSNSSASNISGSFSLTVPRLEDLKDISQSGQSSREISMGVVASFNVKSNTNPNYDSTYSLSFDIDITVDKNEGTEYGGVTHDASTEDGETDTTVPEAIVVGVAATAAGVAGAAAASAAASSGAGSNGGSDKSNKSDKDEVGVFKMYVGKNFGDGIRKGAKPVKIWARMVEEKNGKQYPRPDLNSYITVTGQNLNVVSAVLMGDRVVADVSVDSACSSDKAIVTFIYNGKGGAFRNNIVFKVVGDPYYQFRNESEADRAKGYAEGPYPYAVFGDMFKYTVRFTLANTTGYPQEIKAKSLTPEMEVEVARDTAVEYGYVMTITNKTREPATKKIFTKEETRNAELTSVFEDGTKITEKVGLRLYPEGLNVLADKIEKEAERIPVKAYDLELYGDARDKLMGEKFYLLLALKTDHGAEILIPPKKMDDTSFGEALEGDTRINTPENKKIAEKFTFKVDTGNKEGEFYFIPLDEIYQQKKEIVYSATLSVTVVYKNTEYMRFIPFRLIGKLPDPMENWKEEYAKLQRRIGKFSLPGEKDRWLECLKNCATEPPCSVEELRMVSKEILRVYMKYWMTQNKEDYAEVARYDNILYALEWAKFIGDCAFSYLITIYAGPLADAVVTPAKDIFFNCIGEVVACVSRGESFDYKNLEVYKSLNTAGDNVAAKMTVDGIKSNPKQWFYYIAAYYAVSVFRNYCYKLDEEGVSDFYGALTSAFKDMTVNMFKTIAGELFNKWLNSENFQKLAGDKVSKYLTDTIKKNVPGLDVNIDLKSVTLTLTESEIMTKNAQIVEKFLTETIGMGWGRICDKIGTSELHYNEDMQIVYTFRLWEPVTGKPLYCELVLSKVLAFSTNPLSPFMYMFDLFFSYVSGTNAAITFPADPPIERDRAAQHKHFEEYKESLRNRSSEYYQKLDDWADKKRKGE